MPDLTVYEKRACTTCRKLSGLLQERGTPDAPPPDDELIRLMAEHPQIVQRPIVERGDRAVLARPVERVLELLS